MLRVLGCVAVALAPHAAHLPSWTIAFIAGLLGWQALATQLDWPLAPRWLRLALAAAALAGVYATFGHINGESAGAALLCVMLALKFTELRTRRDCLLVLLLAYFVLATECLFSQSIATMAYLSASAWLVTAGLVEMSHTPGPMPARASLRTAGTLLLQAAP